MFHQAAPAWFNPPKPAAEGDTPRADKFGKLEADAADAEVDVAVEAAGIPGNPARPAYCMLYKDINAAGSRPAGAAGVASFFDIVIWVFRQAGGLN